jgi:hypothetical protein
VDRGRGRFENTSYEHNQRNCLRLEPHAIRFEATDFRLFVLFGNGLGVEVICPTNA